MTHTLSGTIFSRDGTTNIGAGVKVYVFNKTVNEQHNGNDTTNYPNLTTASDGTYSCDLDLWTGDATGDEIFVTAISGNKTGYGRVVRTGSSSTCNVTLIEKDPVKNICDFLIQRIKDYNGGSMVEFVKPFFPEGKDNLTKADYPRIGVKQILGPTQRAGTSSQLEKQTWGVFIKLIIWDKKGDKSILSIIDGSSPSVTDNYAGSRLRDFLAKKITEELRKQFNIQPAYDKDPLIQLYYFYKLIKSEPEDFDEEKGFHIQNIEIQMKQVKQND